MASYAGKFIGRNGVRYSKPYSASGIKHVDVSLDKKVWGDDYQLQQWKWRDYKGRPLYRTVWVIYKKIGWIGSRSQFQKISGDFPNLQAAKTYLEDLVGKKLPDGEIWTSTRSGGCECNFCRGVEKRRMKKCKDCGEEICHCDTYCHKCLEKINGPKEMPINGETVYKAANEIVKRLRVDKVITKEEYDILRLVVDNYD